MVETEAGGIRVGGLVTLTQLSTHPLVATPYRVLAEAAGSAATPQIRNVGTVAGNICQRPWCVYFRQKFPCYKHGGNRCFSRVGENEFNAIFGGGPSYIVHPSDTAPALVALGASFRIVGPGGERVVPASDFFRLPRFDVSRENILEPNEVLADIRVPSASGLRSTYAKVLDRLQTGVASANRLRLRETTWLAREDFKAMLTPLIDAFRARGGTVEIA